MILLRHNCRSERGVALIIVMLVITVLVLIAGGFAYSMKVETTLARYSNSDVEFEWLARSGVEMARFAVGQQLKVPTEPYDSANQFWSGGHNITNEIFQDMTLDNVPLGRGTFSVKIVDQERKFNINAADDTVLRLALGLVGVDAGQIPAIADSILDWIDPDDMPRINGTESDYYMGLNPPYTAKNGPIDNLTELMLIRGITPEMYYGSAAVRPPQPVSATGRALTLQNRAATVYTNALVDMFTPISARLINLNTASPIVLQLVPGIDANMAEAIVRYRAGPDGVEGTEDDTPFRNAGELRNIAGFSPQAIQGAARIFSVRSAVYEATVSVDIGGVKREMVAMLLRNNSPNDVRVLFTFWK